MESINKVKGKPIANKKALILLNPKTFTVDSLEGIICKKGAIAPSITPIIIIVLIKMLIPIDWWLNFVFVDKVCFWFFVDVDFI